MNNILYLSYGKGPHEQEVIFSLLTAWFHTPPENSQIRFLVYTDRPEVFEGLPVNIEYIRPEVWNEWSGPQGFNHRRKILALKHAIEKNRGTTIFLDGDTWVRKPISRLFQRIESGKTIMHIREGRVSEVQTPVFQKLKKQLESHTYKNFVGNVLPISGQAAMWNAGVIGIHSDDVGLLDEVLYLTDQICKHSRLHIPEQFAFSYILETYTELQESADAIFHYWPPYLHEPFRNELPAILQKSSDLPLSERVNYCYQRRPRPTIRRRGKVILKRCLQVVGLIQGRARSNEW